MNDWWNDPPQELEAPSCPICKDGVGEYQGVEESDTGEMVEMYECDECGTQFSYVVQADPEPEDFGPEPDNQEPPEITTCPHGRESGVCDDCDHFGDLAYDAARERRVFGR